MSLSFHTLQCCKMIWQATEGFCCCSTVPFTVRSPKTLSSKKLTDIPQRKKKRKKNHHCKILVNVSFPQCCTVLKSVKTMSYQSCRKRTWKYFASFSHVILCIKPILTYNQKSIFFFHQLSETALLSNKEHIPHLTYLFLFVIIWNITFSKELL